MGQYSVLLSVLTFRCPLSLYFQIDFFSVQRLHCFRQVVQHVLERVAIGINYLTKACVGRSCRVAAKVTGGGPVHSPICCHDHPEHKPKQSKQKHKQKPPQTKTNRNTKNKTKTKNLPRFL